VHPINWESALASLAGAILSGNPQDGPHRLRTGGEGKGAMHRLAMLVVSVVLAFGTFAWVAPAPVAHAQSGYSPDGEELAFVDLLNAYRGSIGLAPVSLNYQLGAAADYHSYDMGVNNYFDHYLFDGTDAGTNITNFGYTAFPYAENIAAGMSTAQEVLIAWQNSPEHNATMTDPQFAEVGIGRYYQEGSLYGWYWTATYGAGGGAPAAPVETAPVQTLAVENVPVENVPVENVLVENVPVETAPVEVVAAEPVVTDVDATGLVQMDGVTDTYQEPATIVTDDGGVVEMQQNAVDADGDRAVSTGSNPVADGTGDTIIYGDINTGGVQGESVVYEAPSLSVTGEGTAPAPTYTETTYVEPTYTETAPTYVEGTVTTETTVNNTSYSGPNFNETTTTNISMEDGNGRAIG
jgi:uncharacterized protein YkwD